MTNFVRLPYRLAKGSAVERFNRAEKCNKQVFDVVKKKVENGNVKLETLRDAFESKLHRMITCIISKEERGGVAGGTALLQSRFNQELSGYEVFLPIQKDETLNIQDIHVAMHEFRHVFDMINNPKINQRKIIMGRLPEASLKINYMDSIYNNKIYTRKKYDKFDILDAIEMMLAPFSKEEQVGVLQLIRYRLKLEHNAYKETTNIQSELKRLYGDSFNQSDYISVREFNFPRKIKLVEERLKEALFECRAENAKKRVNRNKLSF